MLDFFAVFVAVGQELAQIHKGFFRIALMHGIELGSDFGKVQCQFAGFVQGKSHGIGIRLQTGLEEERFVGVVVEGVVGVVDDFDDVFGLFIGGVVERRAFLAGETVQDADFVACLVKSFA